VHLIEVTGAARSAGDRERDQREMARGQLREKKLEELLRLHLVKKACAAAPLLSCATPPR
jgi:hypothetical protein